MTPQRGEIWWVSLDPTQGAEIRKTRPCLVLTTNTLNRLLNSSASKGQGVDTSIATFTPSPCRRSFPYRSTRRLMPLTSSTPEGPISVAAPVTGSTW